MAPPHHKPKAQAAKGPRPTDKGDKGTAENKVRTANWLIKAQLELELKEEQERHEAAKQQALELQRQNHALADIFREEEQMIKDLEASNWANEAEALESRVKLREGKQREIATENYIERMELNFGALENEKARIMRGAARREKDLRMELEWESQRGQRLENWLARQVETARRYFELHQKDLEDQKAVHEVLTAHNTAENERAGRSKLSHQMMKRTAKNIQKSAQWLTHQGEILLAADHVRLANAKRQARIDQTHSSSQERSDASMLDGFETDSADHNSTVSSVSRRHIDRLRRQRGGTDGADRIYGTPVSREPVDDDYVSDPMEIDEDTTMRDPTPPLMTPPEAMPSAEMTSFTLFQSMTWQQHRDVLAHYGSDSSDSNAMFPTPSRKRIRHKLDLIDMPNSPKRQKLVGSPDEPLHPELQPKMQQLSIDNFVIAPQPQPGVQATPMRPTPLPLQEPPPRIEALPKESVINKYLHLDKVVRRLTKQRQSDLPPVVLPNGQANVNHTTAEKQSHDARARSLSAGDLSLGQMPGMWPPEAPTEAHAIGRCKRVWSSFVDWLSRTMQENPSQLIASTALSLWVGWWLWQQWQDQQEYNRWMAANEIPVRVASQLRNTRVSEIRWVESMLFGFTQWLDYDRSLLG